MTPKKIVLAFWEAMKSNDFNRASKWLSEEYECIWPQSNEIIRGRKNFIEINSQYPSNGLWKFQVNEIVEDGTRVITDGKMKARAITFHTVELGLITNQKEFWPDSYEAPSWRKQWVVVDSNLTNSQC